MCGIVGFRDKTGGLTDSAGRVALTLDVDAAFDGADGLEAYERLLHDVMVRAAGLALVLVGRHARPDSLPTYRGPSGTRPPRVLSLPPR